MNAYAGRRGTPKPPQAIWDELGRAGASGDPTALAIAQGKYLAWLDEQGIPYRHQGTHRPDEAQR